MPATLLPAVDQVDADDELTSMTPKPNLANASSAIPAGSRPEAKPIGLLTSIPNARLPIGLGGFILPSSSINIPPPGIRAISANAFKTKGRTDRRGRRWEASRSSGQARENAGGTLRAVSYQAFGVSRQAQLRRLFPSRRV